MLRLISTVNSTAQWGRARLALVPSLLCFVVMVAAGTVMAAPQSSVNGATTASGSARSSEAVDSKDSPRKDSEPSKSGTTISSSPAPSVEDRIRALEDALRLQNEKLEQMGKTIEDQRQIIKILNANSPTHPVPTAPATAPSGDVAVNQASPAAGSSSPQSDAEKKLDELYKRLGTIRISGDVRFRVETFANQGFDSLAEQPSRVRLRVRARLALDGVVNNHFDWGLKLATGVFTDPITTNQTMTDFFERKAFGLERVFVRYDSKGEKAGVQLVAGKFEPPFRRTQLVWDDDVNVEGASEAVYFKTKSSLRQFKLIAFQLPFDEQSAGKDGVLYGGQAQSDWHLSDKVSAAVNLGYYDWVRADRVLQALGAPITTVNGGIQNGSAVTGGQNGALGTTNRVIRNAAGTPIGFLADFHLLDLLGSVTWQATHRLPVIFTFDYVRNVSNRIDDEKNGYWGVVQLGQTREKGDWMASYGFTRIQQDAVLVPFNFSDILATNSRVHMPTVAYQLANAVTLQWTGLFSQRVNKIVPLSPFNRWQNRMAFDVMYKF